MRAWIWSSVRRTRSDIWVFYGSKRIRATVLALHGRTIPRPLSRSRIRRGAVVYHLHRSGRDQSGRARDREGFASPPASDGLRVLRVRTDLRAAGNPQRMAVRPDRAAPGADAHR